MLCYLVGKPGGWKVRVTDLRNRAKEGRNAVRTALDELRRLGYAEFVRPRNEKGVFTDGVWKISDAPIFQPFTPRTGKPVVDNPDADSGYHSKKESTKKEFSKNQSEEAKETANQFAENVSSFPATWIPNPKTKAQQLAAIDTKRLRFPNQVTFEKFLEDEQLDNIQCYRPDLYSELTDVKFHQWRVKGNRWIPIRDWKAYVTAFNETIGDSKTGF